MIAPTMEIEVIGSKRRVKLTALIDTGFSGYLSIPTRIARELGLELSGEQEVQLADGQWVNRLEFSGKVRFLSQTQNVTVFLTNGEIALVGTLLLSDCRLAIDFPGKKIEVVRVPPD